MIRIVSYKCIPLLLDGSVSMFVDNCDIELVIFSDPDSRKYPKERLRKFCY